MKTFVLLFGLGLTLAAQPRKLLVLSIDGLDARYLKDPGAVGVRIPNLRRLAAEGAVADGVVGVVPTVTWPSHTTMITGVVPSVHGIPTNDQPGQPGQRWWYTRFLKARTLWQAALEQKRKVAAAYWPVTLGAEIQFNFPEFWENRSGHDILFEPIARHATPGLLERVSDAYPSFPRSRWTDVSAMQALRFLLEHEQPDLSLVHIADLDAEQHDFGAFTRPAKAVLEAQDELLGWVLEKLPPGTLVALVSDHGFENADRTVRPRVMLREAGSSGKADVKEGLVGALDEAAARFFRERIGRDGIAREVPMEEVRRMAPSLGSWTAAFDSLPGHVASAEEKGEPISDGSRKGVHGLWPTRANYRATFLMWGEGVRRTNLGEISMLEIAPTLAEVTGLSLPAAKARSLWPHIKK